ncbi:MAG: MotA/TolQ/ExbB proton channel family protein [Spirochaetota bacterium]
MWNLFDVFNKGGLVMYPIALCSVIAVAFIIEKFIYLHRIRIDVDNLIARVKASLEAGKMMEAIAACDAAPGPIATVFKAGLKKADGGRDVIKEAIETAANVEIPKIERFLPALATIGSIAPLLGLLGTIFGMIRAFNVIAMQGTGDPHAMAGGISEALIATAAGLIVAIPAVIAYNYFLNRVNAFISDMEARSAEVLDLLTTGTKKKSWSDL